MNAGTSNTAGLSKYLNTFQIEWAPLGPGYKYKIYDAVGEVPGAWRQAYRIRASVPGLLYEAPTAAGAVWVALRTEDPDGRESALSAPVRVSWP